MKKFILVGLAIGIFSVAQAKVNVPEGTFIFPLSKEQSSLTEVEIRFRSEERDKGDTLVALVVGKSDKGKTEEGNVACVANQDGSEIKCERNDGGGDFTLIRTKTISGSAFKYSLKVIYFALGEEGEEDPVAIQSADDEKAIEIPGTQKI